MEKIAVKFPYEDSAIANYLRKQIDALAPLKSQREIAAEMGYEKPNILSMFKRGEAKVPLDRIPAMAKALNVDPIFLFRLSMEQYWTDKHAALSALVNNIVSNNEMEIVKAIREISENTDPPLTEKLHTALLAGLK